MSPIPPITPSAFASTSFDFIIIGGGTAGLVLASRLSSNPHYRVGVLEAGEWRDDDKRVYLPGMMARGVGDQDLDWTFETVPQTALAGRKIPVPRGKMVGGSSGLNFMVWGRAGRGEYQIWKDVFGMEGWGWDEFVKYSKKSETLHSPENYTAAQLAFLPTPTHDPAHHGTTGPIQTSFTSWHVDGAEHLLPTINNLNVPTNLEPMGGDNVGRYLTVLSVDPTTGRRSYAAPAYLKPIVDRQNLVVLTGAHVAKIVLDKEKVARAVEFIAGGERYTVKVKKEVILAAGALQSPQILELSGIGGREVLEKVGVECLVDNPNVGENFRDHIMVNTTYELNPGVITSDNLLAPGFFEKAFSEDEKHNTGIFSAVHSHYIMIPLSTVMPPDELSQLISTLKKSLAATPHSSSSARDNLVMSALISQLESPTGPTANIEIIWGLGSFNHRVTPVPGASYLTLPTALLQPFSQGYVHISTSDPLTPPLINPAILSNPADQKMLLRGLQFADKVARTSPLSSVIKTRVDPPLLPFEQQQQQKQQGPGAVEPTEPTDQQKADLENMWKSHITNTTGTVFHPAGTCSMLPRNKGGVVDERLKIYGVPNIRVVDASVLPVQIGVHIQATVYAVAEKAADMVLEDWNVKALSAL